MGTGRPSALHRGWSERFQAEMSCVRAGPGGSATDDNAACGVDSAPREVVRVAVEDVLDGSYGVAACAPAPLGATAEVGQPTPAVLAPRQVLRHGGTYEPWVQADDDNPSGGQFGGEDRRRRFGRLARRLLRLR